MMPDFCGYFCFNTEEVEEVCEQNSSSTRSSAGHLSKAKVRVLILLPPGHVVRNEKYECHVFYNISHSAQPVPSHPDQSYNKILGLSQS